MAGRLFLMMGTPGAGKSTFIRNHVRDFDNQVGVSRDVIRFRIVQEGEPYFSREDEVFDEFIGQINYFLSQDLDVYADATHLNRGSRAKVLRRLTSKPREVSVIWLQTQLGVCLQRNEERKGTRAYVPPTQLRCMAHNLQIPSADEGINKLYIIRPNEHIQIITLVKEN